MPNFFQKTAFKIRLLFTKPRLFWAVVQGLWSHYFGKPADPNIPRRLSTDLETETLKKYAGTARLGIVEIGVFDGGNTKEMSTVSHVPIYGIDPLIPDSMGPQNIGKEEYIRNNMQYYRNFHFIKDYSYNVAKDWDKPFDFIFIDGDHTYEAVRRDFEDWFSLLSSNGIIAFHDSAPVTSIMVVFEGWPGPVRLVNELKRNPDLQFIESVDSLSVFRKIA